MSIDNEAEALKFFDQLEEFSKRYVRAELGFFTSTSPWGVWNYSSQGPKGAVLHYTADEDLVRVLRWFLDEKLQARVSAHVIIADRRLASHDSLASDLPLIRELPVTIVQTRNPYTQAWHATWANSVCYGIENLNAGPLKAVQLPKGDDPGQFSTWRRRGRGSPDWTDPWNSSYKSAVKLYGGWWSPYPSKQIHGNIIVLRYVQQLFGSLKRPWILGHDQVQRGKRDPGPAFPIHDIREAIFDGWTPVRRYDWYRLYEVDRLYGQTERDSIVIDYVRKEGSENPNPHPVSAWTRFNSAIRALPEKPGEFGLTGKTGLKLLGYHVQDSDDPNLDTDDLISVRVFQRMAGLVTDSKPGRKTKEALVARLEEHKYLTDF